jgi:perosamine synthetase
MSVQKEPAKRQISASKYFFHAEGIEFIVKSIGHMLARGDHLTMGAHCAEFEQRFSEYMGVSYAVTTNSGTSALEIICRALDIEGGEIIVPTNTFAASAYAIIAAGGVPVFCDIGEDLCLDTEDVKKRITPKTKAVMTVHIGGLVSSRFNEIQKLCRERKLYLIEDACQAHGTMFNGKMAGTFGVAGALSFFPTKVMTTAEGGMIVTDNRDIYKKALVMRNQGKSPKGIYQNYHEVLSYNWRMTELQALLGLAQMEMLESFIRRRSEVANFYDEHLEDLLNIRILKPVANSRHNYFKYIVFLEAGQEREALHRKMKACGVDLSGYVYEIPLHKQPVFKGYMGESLPNAERLCQSHICLPIYYRLTDEEAIYVTESLKRCLTE